MAWRARGRVEPSFLEGASGGGKILQFSAGAQCLGLQPADLLFVRGQLPSQRLLAQPLHRHGNHRVNGSCQHPPVVPLVATTPQAPTPLPLGLLEQRLG